MSHLWGVVLVCRLMGRFVYFPDRVFWGCASYVALSQPMGMTDAVKHTHADINGACLMEKLRDEVALQLHLRIPILKH